LAASDRRYRATSRERAAAELTTLGAKTS
jgi:hypothetical protein